MFDRKRLREGLVEADRAGSFFAPGIVHDMRRNVNSAHEIHHGVNFGRTTNTVPLPPSPLSNLLGISSLIFGGFLRKDVWVYGGDQPRRQGPLPLPPRLSRTSGRGPSLAATSTCFPYAVLGFFIKVKAMMTPTVARLPETWKTRR